MMGGWESAHAERGGRGWDAGDGLGVVDTLGIVAGVVVGELLGFGDGDGDFVGLGDGEGSGSRCPGTHPASTTVGQAPSTQFQTPYNVLPTQEPSPVHEMLQWPVKVG